MSSQAAHEATEDAPTIEPTPLGLARTRGQGPAVAMVWAAANGALLAWAHQAAPEARVELLPGFWLGALFLVFVTYTDVEARRIPNAMTVPAMLIGLGASIWLGGGAEAVWPAFRGLLVPFAVLLPFFAFRLMGAGDIKAFMALGALWSAWTTLQIVAWTLLIMGGAAVLVLSMNGDLGDFLRRWGRMARRLLGRADERGYEAPAADSSAVMPLPAGAAIAPATVLWLFAGGPL